MVDLMAKIKEDARKRKVSGIEMSSLVNVSRGMMSNYLNNVTEMPILKFIQLVTYIYNDRPQKTLEAIKEFITKAERRDNLQEVLEWISNRGDDELFSLLFKKFLESNELTDDFKVYNLLYKRNMKKISARDFYIQVENFKENKHIQKETKILLKIATLYSFWDLKNYNMMFLADDIIESIKNIESEYLRTSFKIRTMEMLATAYFRKNEVKEVIKIGKELLTAENEINFPLPINSIYILLAEANVFQDPLESFLYIDKAIKNFENSRINSHVLRKKVLESTHDFIKIHNNVFEGLYLTDPSEEAHLYAKLGKNEKALEVLTRLEKSQGKLTGHQYYYKGLATGNIKDMEYSLTEFINNGDSFYAQLPNSYILNNKLKK